MAQAQIFDLFAILCYHEYMSDNRFERQGDSGMPVESNDDALLRALGGAKFAPGAKLTLPSGVVLDADEVQVFSELFGGDGQNQRGDESGGAPPGWHVGPERLAGRRHGMELKDWEIRFFLEKEGAVDCPPDMYAKWLDAYMRQGGRATHIFDYPMERAGIKLLNHPPELKIPEAFGARALTLVILDKEGRDLSPREDARSYGHGRVYRLTNTPDGVVATTNQPSVVPVYTDVADILLAQ